MSLWSHRTRLFQFKFSSCILNWFGWILKLDAVNPKKEASPRNWISHVSSFNPWNRSATATSELSCHSCKILLIDLPNNFSRWQTRPSSHKYKLNYFTRWMLRRWNALKILCFVYTLTYFLAILKPTRRGKQSLTVESSHSDEARNGAHSFTLPTGTINKLLLMLDLYFVFEREISSVRNDKLTTADQCTMCSQNHPSLADSLASPSTNRLQNWLLQSCPNPLGHR